MQADDDPSDQWFRDDITEGFAQLHRIESVVYTGKTAHQAVQILEAQELGRCLVLDGKLQSAESDEFVYHEALVHPALAGHAHPRTVFIAGGGEGATLRETLNYGSVEQVIMVDIDAELVALCRRFLPGWHQGAFDDARASVLHLDARRYLADTKDRFDVIVIDVTDPTEGTPSSMLFTHEFYSLVNDRLNPGGMIVTQAESASWNDCELFGAVYNTTKQTFPDVLPYQVHVPSYGEMWGFVLAGSECELLDLDAAEIDRRIATRTTRPLRFYDGVTHEGMVSLPRHLRRAIARNTTVITDSAPAHLTN